MHIACHSFGLVVLLVLHFKKNKPQTRFVNPVSSAAEFVPNFTPPTPAAPVLEEDIDM